MQFEALNAGDVLAGRYVIESRLGAGGMGVVYKARHKTLFREYAVKIMTGLVEMPEAAREKRLARFEREAALLSLLDHPNVPTVHDHWIDDGVGFLVMEFIEGKDLGYVLDREGTLSVLDALYVGIEVAKPLSVAHQKDVVHRDIKPENIMCCTKQPPEGKALVRLLDFGVAKVDAAFGSEVTRGRAVHQLTSQNALIGTMPYAPPEMLRGGETDARGDIWSLGIVLYECLDGYPFCRNASAAPSAMELVAAMLREEPPRLRDLRPDVSARFSDAVARMMAKHPADRFPTMAAVYDELWACFTEEKRKAEALGKVPSIFRKAGLALTSGQEPAPRRTGWISNTSTRAVTAQAPLAVEPEAAVAPRDEPKPADDWLPNAVRHLETLGTQPSTAVILGTLTRGLAAHEPALRAAAAASLAKVGGAAQLQALSTAAQRESDPATAAVMTSAVKQLSIQRAPQRVTPKGTVRIDSSPAGESGRVAPGGTVRMYEGLRIAESDEELFGEHGDASAIAPKAAPPSRSKSRTALWIGLALLAIASVIAIVRLVGHP